MPLIFAQATSCIQAFFQISNTFLTFTDSVLRRGPGVHSGPQLPMEQEMLRRRLSG